MKKIMMVLSFLMVILLTSCSKESDTNDDITINRTELKFNGFISDEAKLKSTNSEYTHNFIYDGYTVRVTRYYSEYQYKTIDTTFTDVNLLEPNITLTYIDYCSVSVYHPTISTNYYYEEGYTNVVPTLNAYYERSYQYISQESNGYINLYLPQASLIFTINDNTVADLYETLYIEYEATVIDYETSYEETRTFDILDTHINKGIYVSPHYTYKLKYKLHEDSEVTTVLIPNTNSGYFRVIDLGDVDGLDPSSETVLSFGFNEFQETYNSNIP